MWDACIKLVHFFRVSSKSGMNIKITRRNSCPRYSRIWRTSRAIELRFQKAKRANENPIFDDQRPQFVHGTRRKGYEYGPRTCATVHN